MRIQFSDLSRPKQAAKNIARLSSATGLAAVQESLARSIGYRDWHDFSMNSGANTVVAALDPEVARIIGQVADATGLPDGDIQYAMAKARLFGSSPWSLEDQLALRADLWRKRIFGAPAQGKPGTVVKDMAYGAGKPVYLLRSGRPSVIMSDEERSGRADFEVVTPRVALPDFVPSRLWLPYGYWSLRDGSEVIFSRDYLPMWRVQDGVIERLDPWLWIEGKTRETHFPASGESVWARGAARERALAHLAGRRISELPQLVDVMAFLIEEGVDSISDAVRALHEKHGRDRVPPSFASLRWSLA
jgi:hypothetical protein